MSAVSRIRASALSIEVAHDCLERLRLAIASADDSLRSVHRTAPLSAAIERLGHARDLTAQICATLPDSAPVFAEAELAHSVEHAEHSRRREPCPA